MLLPFLAVLYCSNDHSWLPMVFHRLDGWLTSCTFPHDAWCLCMFEGHTDTANRVARAYNTHVVGSTLDMYATVFSVLLGTCLLLAAYAGPVGVCVVLCAS